MAAGALAVLASRPCWWARPDLRQPSASGLRGQYPRPSADRGLLRFPPLSPGHHQRGNRPDRAELRARASPAGTKRRSEAGPGRPERHPLRPARRGRRGTGQRRQPPGTTGGDVHPARFPPALPPRQPQSRHPPLTQSHQGICPPGDHRRHDRRPGCRAGRSGWCTLVANTIMNVTTQDDQVAVFANAAAHLAPGGCFVVAVIVPPLRGVPPGDIGPGLHPRARPRRDRDVRRRRPRGRSRGPVTGWPTPGRPGAPLGALPLRVAVRARPDGQGSPASGSADRGAGLGPGRPSQADALIGYFVDQARRSGAAWSQIGSSMGDLQAGRPAAIRLARQVAWCPRDSRCSPGSPSVPGT